jgi:LacI family transcriptional regulator
MKDVAAVAGVSVATVSHVLNNTKHITDTIRQRVYDAVEALNYKPNINARNFKMGKQQTIGFVVPDIANSFFATLINEVEGVVAKQDYLLLVVNTQENPEMEKQQLHRLTSGLVDGVIVASTFDDYNMVRQVIPSHFPAIFIDRKLKNCNCDTIVISNYNAVYTGVEKLILRGHRRIGCVTGSQHLSTLDERLQAYRNCITEHDLEIDEDLVLSVDVTKKIDTELLAPYFTQNMTAMVFLNNTITVDAFGYLVHRGSFFSRGMEAVGYSDAGWHEYAVKAMDVITQPIAEMGNIAAARILERIENPDLGSDEIVLQAVYVPKQQIEAPVSPVRVPEAPTPIG